jgi:hypothetical protein
LSFGGGFILPVVVFDCTGFTAGAEKISIFGCSGIGSEIGAGSL